MAQRTLIAKPGEVVVFKYPGFFPPTEDALKRAYGVVKDEMLTEGTSAKNEKLHPPFVDQLTVPDGAGENDDCILSCIMKQLGINTRVVPLDIFMIYKDIIRLDRPD